MTTCPLSPAERGESAGSWIRGIHHVGLTVADLNRSLAFCLATLETALIQSTRTLLVMAKDKTMPAALGRIHPSWRTPWVAAIVLTVIAVGLFCASNLVDSVSRLLSYAISAIGLEISVYYGLAGIAVTVAHRKVLLRSASNFVFIGLWPGVGGIFMLAVFVESVRTLGVTTDAVGLGAIGLGIIPLGYYWLRGSPALRRAAGAGRGTMPLQPEGAPGSIADADPPAGPESRPTEA